MSDKQPAPDRFYKSNASGEPVVRTEKNDGFGIDSFVTGNTSWKAQDADGRSVSVTAPNAATQGEVQRRVDLALQEQQFRENQK